VLVNQESCVVICTTRKPRQQIAWIQKAAARRGGTRSSKSSANVKTYSEDTHDDPEVYEPFLQRPVLSFSLMVLASSDPHNWRRLCRSAVAQLDAELPLARVMSMPTVDRTPEGRKSFFTACWAASPFSR